VFANETMRSFSIGWRCDRFDCVRERMCAGT
jgi:hypothetical protein